MQAVFAPAWQSVSLTPDNDQTISYSEFTIRYSPDLTLQCRLITSRKCCYLEAKQE